MIVIFSGHLFCAVGCVLLLTLPFDMTWCLLLCACWLGSYWLELSGLRRGHSNCLAIRLHAGGAINICDRSRDWVPATLQRGSLVFTRLAWIRARSEDGQMYTELLSGDARASHEWRRLQVIWRHIGAAA
jgi:hypothetical protein